MRERAREWINSEWISQTPKIYRRRKNVSKARVEARRRRDGVEVRSI